MQVPKAYKFRIYPNKPTLRNLDRELGLCCELYNAALSERREAYRLWAKHNKGINYTQFENGVIVLEQEVTKQAAPRPPLISYESQCSQLVEIKQARPEFKEFYSQVLQNALKRVEVAFYAFFRRVSQGQTPGYPRFKSKRRYDSLTFPQGSWELTGDKLKLSKLGTAKVKLHRKVTGKVKTVTIKQEGRDKWYVVFSIETEIKVPQSHPGQPVGIDLGLTHWANLSNGEQIENPRYFKKAQKRLAKAQRKWDAVKHRGRGDPVRVKRGKVVTRLHRKVKHCRLDFQHKLSKTLVTTYSLIAVEDLNIKGLGGSILAKSVQDAGWGQFLQMLKYKAAEAGALVVEVSPLHTSQTCPDCGAVAKKELSERWHSCPCGCEMHRDIAAAQVILSRGQMAVRNQSVEAAPL